MSDAAPFERSRPRGVPTVLDTLRARIDHDAFDAVTFSLESVAADLGYGDVRPLPGAIAWIDRLRDEGKRIALFAGGERAPQALQLAGIADRFDAIVAGPRAASTIARALDEVGVSPERSVVVDVVPAGIAAGRELGAPITIAVARGRASPAELRDAGASTVVADLQELLGPS